MSRKLFVGNLPFSAGETELQNLFGQAGAIESVRVMRDNATGRARGFAFVEMQTEEPLPKPEIQPDAFHPRFFSPLFPSKGAAARELLL
jgi:hypothetical protein